jgi:hypothetical protein
MCQDVKNDLEKLRFWRLHPQVRLGTASDRYAGWLGQIYTQERYQGRIGQRTKVVGKHTFTGLDSEKTPGHPANLTLHIGDIFYDLTWIFGSFQLTGGYSARRGGAAAEPQRYPSARSLLLLLAEHRRRCSDGFQRGRETSVHGHLQDNL